MLYKYLQSLPRDLKISLDLTHADWFEERTCQEHLQFLRENKIGFVVNDAPGRSIVNSGLPGTEYLIKFTPDGDLSRVKEWFDKIKGWEKQGLAKAYFFVQPGGEENQQLRALEYFKKLVS